MINDKMAKMAVNTLKAYCNERKCGNCAVSNACSLANKALALWDNFPNVGTFEYLQKPSEKTPKFDAKLRDSDIFKDYLDNILLREAPKLGLFVAGLHKVKCYPNGTIKVWYIDVDDGTVYKGKAKCHPNDAFNPEIGIKLAVQRIAEKLNKTFIPTDGEAYFYVDDNNSVYSTVNHNANVDVLNIAVGNCFKSREKAFSNRFAIAKRIERATELLKKLRDERDEYHETCLRTRLPETWGKMETL